jgi:hypothetical protein
MIAQRHMPQYFALRGQAGVPHKDFVAPVAVYVEGSGNALYQMRTQRLFSWLS